MPSKLVENQLRAFRRRLKRLKRLQPDLIAARRPIFIARAPARLDVMGGVGDYSGGTVLEGTLAEAAFAAAQLRDDGLLVAHSFQAREHGWQTPVIVPLADLYAGSRLKSYSRVRKLFSGPVHWAAYVLGVVPVLLRERIVAREGPVGGGLTVVVDSTVPIGAGVASSGALEVAALAAILGALGVEMEGLRLARLGQMAENLVAGAPCGIMDQVTAALGEAGKLLALRCQPADVLGLHALPAGVATFGIDSAVKHSVGGSRYTRARVATYMGFKIISTLAGEEAYGGYLCNVTPQEFRARWWDRLPSKMTGADFLATYGETDDPVTSVDPEETYSVRGCTAYPIYETARVLEFLRRLDLVRETGDARHLVKAGKLMYAAHWGYRTLLGLGAPETDLLMRLVRRRGPERGLYGAKTSGGGSGGTMAILARADAAKVIEEVAAEYAELTGLKPYVFEGTSPGTLAFGVRREEL